MLTDRTPKEKATNLLGYGSSSHLVTNISISGFMSFTETEPELKHFYNKGYTWKFYFIDTYSNISDFEFSVW
jgi:hypothetical protein